MKLTNNYELRIMAGEYVLMPQNEFLVGTNRPLIINDTMAMIIKKIEDGKTEDEIINEIVSEYEVDEGAVKEQLRIMFDTLKTNKVIEE